MSMTDANSKPYLDDLQEMLDSFEGLRLADASQKALRSSYPGLEMDVVCERDVPLRDGLKAERPSLNRLQLNRMLTR